MAGQLRDLINKCEGELKDLTESFEKERQGKAGNTRLTTCKENKEVQAIAQHPVRERRSLRGHFGKVYALHWCKGDMHDEKLVSASQDGKLIVWNAQTGNKTKLIPLASAWVMTVAYSPSGEYVACGGLDNICSVYKLSAHQIPDEKAPPVRAQQELQHHDGYLSCCRFLDDATMISCSGDHTCVLWNINESKVVSVFEGHENDVMCLAPFGHNNTFISAGCDTTAKVWDTRTKSCVQTHEGHEGDINAIDMFPDSYAFGTGSDDNTCRLFDQRCWGEIGVYKDEKFLYSVTSCAFSSSGRFFVAGYDDFSARIWDTIKGEMLHPGLGPNGHEKRVSCLGINKSGKAICTGSWDDSLKIWA
jgi:guanine nucleotide-binding protein G(I)/G(S)/G(T) subunit beta-1